MREIKFRGYSYAINSWLYGNLIEKDNPEFETPTPWVRLIHDRALSYELVVFDSVGQYTNLKDKNNIDIYEGDRVKQRIVDFENTNGFVDMFYEVRWAKWCFGLYILDKWVATLDTPKANSIEVVGNTYHKTA